MNLDKEKIQNVLKVLIGLPLSLAHRAADMRMFHFGKVRNVDRASVGDFALHLQCPWRIESCEKVITGLEDFWEQDDDGEILQDLILEILLKQNSKSASLIVEEVKVTELGDLAISLTGGYKITTFICGNAGEKWRFFRPGSEDEHLVIEYEEILIEN